MSYAKQLHNRRYLNDYFEIINREGLPGNVKTERIGQTKHMFFVGATVASPKLRRRLTKPQSPEGAPKTEPGRNPTSCCRSAGRRK